MRRKITVEIISSLFILLFAYASLSKLLDYQKFEIQIGQSPLLTGFGDFLPWIVILVEVAISIMMMIVSLRLIALFAAFSLMTIFTTYIVAILNYSSYIPCSCGGVLEKLGWSEHLVFNCVFVALGFLGIALQSKEYEKESTFTALIDHPI